MFRSKEYEEHPEKQTEKIFIKLLTMAIANGILGNIYYHYIFSCFQKLIQ